MGWFLVTLCFTVVNLSVFTSEILSGRNIEENILYGSITFFGCLVMLRAFSRKSIVSFKANTKTVEYSVEYFFRKKFGTLSLDEIEKITEIETPGFGSDPKCYRLALVTTVGTIVPLSYTDDNITDHTKLINLVNEWLRRMKH